MRIRLRALSLLVCTSLVLFAGACKSGSGSKPDEPLTDDKPAYPSHFSEIPADSLYVYTGLEPVPEDLMVAGLERAKASMTGSYFDSMRTMAKEQSLPPTLLALLDELEGNVSPAGMKELGMSLSPTYAIYGLGGMPTFRMELGDAAAFEAMVNRVESKSAGASITKKEADGVTYRIYEADELRVPMVIRDGEVIVSVAHEETLETVLPYLLGQKTPDKSLADANQLDALVDQYGYKKWSAGYVDIESAIRRLSGIDAPGPVLAATLEAFGVETPEQSESCTREIGESASAMPRAVMGIQSYTDADTVGHAGLEVKTELAGELAGSVEPIPGMDSEFFEGATMALGMGLNVEKLSGILKGHLKAIAENPYQCEHFDSVNRYAQRYQSQPLPPVVKQLRGVALILDRIEFGAGSFIPTSLDAVAIVGIGNPQSLLGRLQPFVPGLMQANVQSDGVPVALDQLGQVVAFLKSPHLAMTEEKVAFSTGVGMQDEMAALLEEPSAEASMAAMAMSYDFDKLMEGVPDSSRKQLEELLGESASLSLQGSASMRLMFDGNGVFMKSRTQFPQAGESSQSGAAESSK